MNNHADQIFIKFSHDTSNRLPYTCETVKNSLFESTVETVAIEY